MLGYARHYRLLKELEINIPPLPEQQRIVGLLDEAFADLATATANTERKLVALEALKKSLLHEAFADNL